MWWCQLVDRVFHQGAGKPYSTAYGQALPLELTATCGHLLPLKNVPQDLGLLALLSK